MPSYLPLYVKIYLYGIAAVLGLILGSAFNCLSYRIAHGEKWSGKARSACPSCGHVLKAADLIPVFSFLFLGGKCRYCGKKISPRYPITEAVLSLCFVSLLFRFGLSPDIVSTAVLCCCLFCLSLVDLETQIIPDRFLLIPAAVRAIQLVWEGGLSGLGRGCLPGICLAGGVLILSLIMDNVLKKDTMGGGDIKLMAVLGMYFSFGQCLLLLIFACVLGIVIGSVLMRKDSETAFPFGPALSLAAWLTLLWGEQILSWYGSFFV